MRDLLRQFIQSFQKAILGEMNAMRERMGPYEASLSAIRSVDTDDDGAADINARHRHYEFVLPAPNDKLVLNGECSLRFDSGEEIVTIIALERDKIILRCERSIPPDSRLYTLVIYPWFLYEKLCSSLEGLLQSDSHFPQSALRLFGKYPPNFCHQELAHAHPSLNASQIRAVQLCLDSDLAFVWGPPGTGKTTTLAHIAGELIAHKQRILIASTTNAAVDQALGQLARLDDVRELFERGEIVRVGQTSAETHGASLAETVERLSMRAMQELARLKARRMQIQQAIRQSDFVLEKIIREAQPQQLDFFSETKQRALHASDLGPPIFSEPYAISLSTLPPERQENIIRRRRERLRVAADLCGQKISRIGRELRDQQPVVVKNARVILATMTNMYISQLLTQERFDAVIVEEAGMAILPTLFYSATLARAKTIMVGDPKQLPPIVQSNEPYVRRAMGRCIYEVVEATHVDAASPPRSHSVGRVVDTASPPRSPCEIIAMLDTQYRMHPVIGNLISEMFYDGKLVNAPNTKERAAIAARKPFAGEPLILINMEGRSICARRDGSSSRYNEATAALCCNLAKQAIASDAGSIAIITPYAEQSRLIRKLLSDAAIPASQVECSTVHRFQGNERDVVILDTVDAPPFRPGVLLSDESPYSSAANLLNVSVSRACGKLIVVSEIDQFLNHSPESVIAELLRRMALVGKTIPSLGIH